MIKKNLLLASGLLLGGTLLTGCGQAVSDAAPAVSAGTATTVENCGRTLSFGAAPLRTVAMTPGQSELLVRLGLADKVVAEAQSKGRKLMPELAASGTVQQLSQQGPPSREVLLGVGPDLVYSPTGYEFTAEQGFASIEQLKAAGAESYISTAGCLERRGSAEVRDLLVDIAADIGLKGGVYGSRMTGGGFGGCTVSLVRADKAQAITRRLYTVYLEKAGIEPTIFATRPSDGARAVGM